MEESSCHAAGDRSLALHIVFVCYSPADLSAVVVLCVHYRPPMRYPVQQLALYYWSFHYAKRILETFFVHK